jgi:hypothetical protein
MAPAKVLHGAVRLQGLASSPTPETQVRVACAWAAVDNKDIINRAADMLDGSINLRIRPPEFNAKVFFDSPARLVLYWVLKPHMPGYSARR